jgi:prefoldin alpha subunit
MSAVNLDWCDTKSWRYGRTSQVMVGHTLTILGEDKPILVPLTTSLYVPGTLADKENVIVDVGTGFYVEKVRKAVR